MTPILKEEMPKPDLEGRGGRAWRSNLEECRKELNVRKEDDGSVASWIVEAPWAHGFWHSYWLMLVHLRPMPDGRETKFYLKGATHELWLYALDPDHPRAPALTNLREIKRLTPKNFAAQFVATDDDEATAKMDKAVKDIVDGQLSPDTGFIRHWAHRFGDNMLKDGAGETRIVINPGEDSERQIVIPPHPGRQDLN